jgi:DNA-binding MarR family transcriptional regulator
MVDDCATDWAVLALLLDPDDRLPWSAQELAREIGDQHAVTDSLKRLDRAGLIHRCDDFAFPTRPARRFEALRD